jgi:tripartite-type tricarboxylate transporter receptor subunit TctC
LASILEKHKETFMDHARRLITAAIAAAVLGPAFAQQDHATLIVPHAAGGQTDVTARLFADQLRAPLGRPVIVENRTGAGGAIGVAALTQAAPDGATFMVGGIGTHLLPLMNKSVKYDPDKQLRPVALISSAPLLLVVRADSPYKTLPELLQAGKRKPLNFGSSGVGTTPHLAAEWLMAMTSTPGVHVPYRGGPALTQAVLAGDVDFVFDPVLSAAPLVKAGKLRALGMTAPAKIPDLPAVPAISDTVTGYSVTSWLGIYLPAGTPDAAVSKLEGALKTVATDPKVQAKLLEMGNPANFKGAAEFQRFIADETTRYGTLTRQQNIRAE